MSSYASVTARAVAFVALVLGALSCGGPTTPTPERTEPAEPEGAIAILDLDPSAQRALEEFNCRDLEEVHFRFSAPGYVDGTEVGLYASYTGVPAGEKLLRIWWDYENDPTRYRDLALGEGEVRRGDPDRFDIERLVEHAYTGVEGRVRKLVRAELIVRGKTGNCARNRVVTLEASPPATSAAAVDPCDGLRFCDLGDGTVRDNTTGRVWLKNADCHGVRRWAIATDIVAALGTGECGLADGSAPGDWRLPTPSELASLLDPRFVDPRLSNARGDGPWTEGDAFTQVANRFYWTSEPVAECTLGLPGATIVHVGDGTVRCRIVALGFARFWPVRAP